MERKVMTSGLSREMIIHPCETLKEVLQDRNMNQKELALRTGFSEKHISTVLSGDNNISVAFARRMEYALGIDFQFWMNLQNEYDRQLSEFNELNSITEKEIEICKNLKEVIEYLLKNSIIPVFKNIEQKILWLRKFLNVSDLESIGSIVSMGAFRARPGGKVDVYSLFAWLRICEYLADRNETEYFDEDDQKERLLLSIPKIKEAMFKKQEDFIPDLQKIFLGCGISFVIAPFFRNVPVQGFIKTYNGKTILCMTFRQKRADIFWFTLFHEIAHFINGDGKQRFIDFESAENEKEKKADVFSKNSLLDKTAYKAFVNKNDFSLSAVRNFAKTQNVLPCIVIGRLQKENYLKWTDYNSEMIMYSN